MGRALEAAVWAVDLELVEFVLKCAFDPEVVAPSVSVAWQPRKIHWIAANIRRARLRLQVLTRQKRKVRDEGLETIQEKFEELKLRESFGSDPATIERDRQIIASEKREVDKAVREVERAEMVLNVLDAYTRRGDPEATTTEPSAVVGRVKSFRSSQQVPR